MNTGPPKTKELNEILIAAITPQFLERGALWFKENYAGIKRALKIKSHWQDQAMLIEKDLQLKPSEFLRKLQELGYEKTAHLMGQGIFSHRGNIIEVWPINSDHPLRIELFGNTVDLIEELPLPDIGNKIKLRSIPRSIEKAQAGNYLVHIDHGIGIFRGIISQNDGGKEKKFFAVEYAPPRSGARADKLLVPLEQEKRLSYYIGFETPTIHRLGGSLWSKTKRKVKEGVEKMARELLALYAQREQAVRTPYIKDPTLEEEFASGFEFKETEDQLLALEEIFKDMALGKPMDRILCGDVGFGKTELAMRSTLRAVVNGKQVVLISPTTILAHEHYRLFLKRFEKLPVAIAYLSRLTPQKEISSTLKKIKDGSVDIIIGTHRLFSSDVEFKNLGLVMVDEEQRFGVRQKEHFKTLRGDIDILSLSATPIPRTLSLALGGLRSISTVKTPPAGRIPIQTFILPYSLKTVRQAIISEVKRGGQIYFLHNRVETIALVKDRLEKYLKTGLTKTDVKMPAVKIIHGRMPEQEIIKTLEDFRNKKFEVLLATTIIENGLDFSNANTLIVDDASRLGLSQAHQIRGRIGRGNEQAYAYFLYNSRRLGEKVLERLLTLKEYSHLGSGYEIALRDLEMRGSGNILGREQTGAVNKVGLNLYSQMLSEALEELKRRS